MTTTREQVSRLWRQWGFGATPAELDAAEARGVQAERALLLAPAGSISGGTSGGPVDPGVAATPTPTLSVIPVVDKTDLAAKKARAKQLQGELRELRLWWIDRMVAATQPLPEKMSLVWHHHFATSVQKVQQPAYMLRQNEIFRSLGLGDFAPLLTAVAHDPAMLLWLDAGKDLVGSPNENFARECMELFTLGVGNYSESDVREAARAYTGWSFNRKTDAFEVRERQHDNGNKTVLGVTGPLTGDDVLGILVRRPQCALWVASRIANRTVSPLASTSTSTSVRAAVAASTTGPAGSIALAPMIASLASSPEATGTSPAIVRDPVDWVVGALRSLGLTTSDPKVATQVLLAMHDMGMDLFAPPSVGGWPAQLGWLSTAASLARLRFARAITEHADLSAVADAAPAERIDAVGHLLGVSWPAATVAALAKARTPSELVALALVSPPLLVA